MKSINKSKKQSLAVFLCTAMVFTSAGCGKTSIPEAYNLNSNVFGLLSESTNTGLESHLMSNTLCVVNENIDHPGINMDLAESAALFDLTEQKTLYAKDVHKQLYPASTTKILTAYIVLKYGNLNDIVTITQENIMLESGSSHCGLRAGDQISVRDLLYGLMLKSGNDAANALADYISGSTEEFAKLMNQEALVLGATNSNFVNAHGLHDDNHYTTVYDLYLIFQSALKNDTFRELCSSKSYIANFSDSTGAPVSVEWSNTMQYFTGNQIPPENVTVLAGKTGTTSKAQSCLVLLSQNSSGKEFISIILKSQDRGVLYTQMNDLLEEINK